MISIAGPLFNTHERWYLEQIAAAREHVGYPTFLPHRDAGLLREHDRATRQRIFRDDLHAVAASRACVALLTGADHDSGTSAELGDAYARAIPCFGISDDPRWVNTMIWGICGAGEWLVTSIPALIALLQKHVPVSA